MLATNSVGVRLPVRRVTTFASPEEELRVAVEASREALCTARLDGAVILAGPRHFFEELTRMWESWLRLAGCTRVKVVFTEQPGAHDARREESRGFHPGTESDAQLFVVVHCNDVPRGLSPRCVALYTEHELPERPAHGSLGRFRVAWHLARLTAVHCGRWRCRKPRQDRMGRLRVAPTASCPLFCSLLPVVPRHFVMQKPRLSYGCPSRLHLRRIPSLRQCKLAWIATGWPSFVGDQLTC